MKKVIIIIDHKSVEFAPGLTTGQELINLAGLAANEQLLLERIGDVDILVTPQDAIILRGGEEFVLGDGSPVAEDNPCLKHPIHLNFNGHPVAPDKLFPRAKVTGAEIKQLDPNLKPSDQLVSDIDHLADEVIPDNLRLILQKHDKFITAPCGNVGDSGIEFNQLTEVKHTYPEARIEEFGGQRYLVVPNCSITEHWNSDKVTVMVILPNGFPIAAPDMFWVMPHLALQDGRVPEGASQIEQHMDKSWQRFSWHMTEGAAAWRVGHSSMLTYLHFCMSRLALAK